MTRSIIIFLFCSIFISGHILPLIGPPGLIGEAYAMMGGKAGITVKKRVTGNVGEIDRNMNTVTIVRKISNREFRTVFMFDANTTVSSETGGKSIADLKTGDNVIITYIISDGQNLAQNIVIKK